MSFSHLYGTNRTDSEAKARFLALADNFKDKKGLRFYSSSGRAEILGNHTDHNHGKVLVAAISCDIAACVKKTDNNTVTVQSEGYREIVVDLNDLEPKKEEYGTSTALVRGVARALKDRGYSFGGFTAYSTSDIFKGAGVSSSAAFEVLIAEIFNDLYLGGKLTAVQKAIVSQYAENVFFGKPCGLLDQSGIAIGALSKLDFNVPEQPEINKLPLIEGYSLVITNTGGNHAALTPHYAAIREEMHSVAGHFGKQFLRDVDYAEFLNEIPAIAKKLPDRAILRAIHFYNENVRVENAARAITAGDIPTFLNCVNGSGLSSLSLLQNCYVPGETTQPVVLGTEVSREIIKDGAVRVHGGGFAGSILAIVADGETAAYAAQMQRLFGKENVFIATIREPGTTRVDI